MPLIRSAITWSAEKVSASLKSHPDSNVEALPAPGACDTASEYSLSHQSTRDPTTEPHIDINDSAHLREKLDTGYQPTYPNDEFNPEQTALLSSFQTQQPKKNAEQQATYPAPAPTAAYTYPPPTQSTNTPHNRATVNEDRNRADFYQAKYCEAQRLSQARFQTQGQSAQSQYGDDCGMVSCQQQQSGMRRGSGGRGRGRRRRNGGGLIGTLLKR